MKIAITILIGVTALATLISGYYRERQSKKDRYINNQQHEDEHFGI